MRTYFSSHILITVVLIVILAFTGCGGGAEESAPAETGSDSASTSDSSSADSVSGEYEDGIYFAQEDSFSEQTGWKYVVVLEVDGGEIVSATWDGASTDGGTSKATRSRAGEYGMVANGGAMAPWFEQAAAAEEYLLETQDPTDIEYTSDEGYTDAISGASIHVIEFFTLAEEALNNGPNGYGMWQDGHYYAEEPEFSDNGWKYNVNLTVLGGRIVAANWNGVPEDGGNDKKNPVDGRRIRYGRKRRSDGALV